MTDQLELIASHQINCKGVNNQNEPVFFTRSKHSEGVPIIVNVYKNGKSTVCCQYFNSREGNCQCSPTKSNRGNCPYKKK